MVSEVEKRQRMTALAKTFPGLSHRLEANHCGLDPWDVRKLVDCSKTWNSSEQQIVAFLLTVWNSKQDLAGAFNMVDAVSRWDEGDRQALIAWALKPFAF